MVQIKIDIEEMKSGRASVEMLVGVSKEKPPTKVEARTANQLKTMLALIMTDLVRMCPGSEIAIGKDDVETLKGMENLGFDKET